MLVYESTWTLSAFKEIYFIFCLRPFVSQNQRDSLPTAEAYRNIILTLLLPRLIKICDFEQELNQINLPVHNHSGWAVRLLNIPPAGHLIQGPEVIHALSETKHWLSNKEDHLTSQNTEWTSEISVSLSHRDSCCLGNNNRQGEE